MADRQFPSNSFASKIEAEKKQARKPEKITQGHVSQRKKSLGEKIGETFLKNDIKEVVHSVIFETLIPGVTNTVYDIFDGALRMLLFDEKNPRQSRRDSSGRPYRYTNYSSISKQGDREVESVRHRTRMTIGDDLIFDTRSDAEDVLTEMINYIRDYGAVSAKELYSFAGFDSDYTLEKYGWTNLSNADVIRDREGYSLKLPRPILLDK